MDHTPQKLISTYVVYRYSDLLEISLTDQGLERLKQFNGSVHADKDFSTNTITIRFSSTLAMTQFFMWAMTELPNVEKVIHTDDNSNTVY